ncbi:MAG TPA: hypothetical protein VE132_01350 [Micromonosporaceae bacterium]|nr:hypothetical protein [Micromonosporaceae bacterium]
MPAPTVSTAPDRAEARSRLLAAQFWVGIALAPVAALLLMFGGTAAAAVIAIIAVVVLALSVMLRSDAAPWSRANGTTTDEMNALRDDVRADITTAARATHRALSEKMSLLEESVAGVQRLAESFVGIRRLEDAIAGVQRQVEAARAVAIEARAAVDNQRELPPPSPRRPASVVGSVPGVVRHTETVVTRSMYVDQPADGFEPGRASGSTVYGSASRPAVGHAAIDGTVNGSTTYGSASHRRDVLSDRDRDDSGRHNAFGRDTGRHEAGHYDAGSHDDGRVGASWIDRDALMLRERDAREREQRGGSEREREPRVREPRERESRGGSERGDEPRRSSDWRDEPRVDVQRRDEPRSDARRRDEPRAEEQRWGEMAREPQRRELLSGHDDHGETDRREDTNESWTEQRLRAYLPQMRESLASRSGSSRDDLDSSGDLANDARWSQMRDGDRWAEVRSDDRGRELRMAERHAERHVDQTGTQLRIVDRWSSVREERVPAAADQRPAPETWAPETRAQRRRRAERDDRDDRDEPYPATVTRAELPRPRHNPDEVRAERSSGEVGRGWRDVRSGVIEPDHSDGYGDSRYDVPAQVGPSRDTPPGGWGSYDPPSYDSPSYDSASHDDIGIYRRRSAEPVAYEERDDRDHRWVREPSRRSSGPRPQLDFEVNDDRWH